LKEVWKGYLNPYHDHSEKCYTCDGLGYSPKALKLYQQWYGYRPFDPAENGSVRFEATHPEIMKFATRNVENSRDFHLREANTTSISVAILAEAQRLSDVCFNHLANHLTQEDVDYLLERGSLSQYGCYMRGEDPETKEKCYLRTKNPIPSAQQVNSDSINAGMSRAGSSEFWHFLQRRAKVGGFITTCSECGGDGELWPSQELKDQFHNWDSYAPENQPPKGEGYQLWETTSEGSPMSPVFETLEELCAWCEENATTFGTNKTTKENWMGMLSDGMVVHKQTLPNGTTMMFI